MANWRVLIVEDEERWFKRQKSLLEGEASDRGAGIDVEVAPTSSDASARLGQRHFHVVSMDMLMPAADGTLNVMQGTSLAQRASRAEALSSKLIVYSALLQPGDPNSALVHYDLAKLDRYLKGTRDGPTEHGVEELTAAGWATRVIDYLVAEDTRIGGPQGARHPQSFIGCWLEQAIKHLPSILARHATDLSNSWDVPTDLPRRVNAALRFVEVTTRLALVQTLVLAGLRPDKALPGHESWAAALDMLEESLETYKVQLRRSTWSWHVRRAFESLAAARDLRNSNHHSLAPDATTATWARLRVPLQAAMDLASYWAQHPLWRQFVRAPDGQWLGERIAGNQWPRKRREFAAPTLAMSDAAVRGRGVWQMRVDRVDGDPDPNSPADTELVDWSSWIDLDSNGRAVWLPLYLQQKGRATECVWLDLDQGGYRSSQVRR